MMIYTKDNGQTWASPPSVVLIDGYQYGTASLEQQHQWEMLASAGVYRTWTEPGDSYGLGYTNWAIEPNPAADDDFDVAARYINGTEEELTAAKRQQMNQAIDAQVPDGSAQQLVEDPLFESQIISYAGGASERKSELEDTPDEDIDSFSTEVIPTPYGGTGYIEAKMTTFIDIVDPWAGAPNDIYALRCALRIITAGQEAAGASARAHMFNEAGVDQGVLSFTQDVEDPAVWQSQSQVGRYWSDPTAKASMRLLWDSGSLPVAETKQLNGYGDRQYAVVRAGL